MLAAILALSVPAPAGIPVGAHCLLMRPVAAQEGNPGHREPPPGWTCSQEADTPADHRCTCHRKCVDHPGSEEDGIVTPPSTSVQEDVKCRVYCFKDSCRCPVHDCD